MIKWEIRQIDAWNYGDGWVWNDSIPVGSFESGTMDAPEKFLAALAALGVTIDLQDYNIEDVCDVLEIQANNGEPIFAAVMLL